MADKRIVVDGHIIVIGHADKIFFPEDGLTKWDMVEYYKRIAPVMLPHMQGRPVTMLRMTDGIHGESFYHKETPAYFPDWIKRAPMAKEDGVTNYVICDSAATLAYLADQACVTPHLWLSRFDKPHDPDLLIFDLDPSSPDFEPVRNAALSLRKLLTELGLPVYVKTTGSRGVHVVSPLDRSADFDTVRMFAEAVARYLSDMEPESLTVEQRKEKRKGRVFIDTLRNSYAQTAVAPYALRARPGAPVAAPITWEELKDPELRPQSYTIKNIFKRLARVTDPWAGMWTIKAGSIDQPWKKLCRLLAGAYEVKELHHQQNISVVLNNRRELLDDINTRVIDLKSKLAMRIIPPEGCFLANELSDIVRAAIKAFPSLDSHSDIRRAQWLLMELKHKGAFLGSTSVHTVPGGLPGSAK